MKKIIEILSLIVFGIVGCGTEEAKDCEMSGLYKASYELKSTNPDCPQVDDDVVSFDEETDEDGCIYVTMQNQCSSELTYTCPADEDGFVVSAYFIGEAKSGDKATGDLTIDVDDSTGDTVLSCTYGVTFTK